MYWVDRGLEHLVQANYNGTEATIIADFSRDRTISNDALGEVPVTFDEKGKKCHIYSINNNLIYLFLL